MRNTKAQKHKGAKKGRIKGCYLRPFFVPLCFCVFVFPRQLKRFSASVAIVVIILLAIFAFYFLFGIGVSAQRDVNIDIKAPKEMPFDKR